MQAKRNFIESRLARDKTSFQTFKVILNVPLYYLQHVVELMFEKDLSHSCSAFFLCNTGFFYY